MALLAFEDKVTSNREAFIAKVKDIAYDLGMDPNWLMAVMWNESGINPSIRNAQKGQTATGLIQFIESTAQGLGTSTAELAKMSNVDQLDYVKKYYQKTIASNGPITNIGDAYLAIFYPAAISWSADKAFSANIYSLNKGLDYNKDGILTKQDVIDKINSILPSKFSTTFVAPVVIFATDNKKMLFIAGGLMLLAAGSFLFLKLKSKQYDTAKA